MSKIMAGNICIIAKNIPLLTAYIESLNQKSFQTFFYQPSHNNLMEALQEIRPSLVIVEEHPEVQLICNLFFNKNYLQNTPILLLKSSNMTHPDNKSFVNVIDDIISMPCEVSTFLDKVQNWINLSVPDTASFPNWYKRIPIIEDKIERVRMHVRQGDFGLATSLLTKVQTLLTTFSHKATEIERITTMLDILRSFVEQGKTLPLLSQINTLDLSLYRSLWQSALDKMDNNFSQELTEKSQEALTQPMNADEFLYAKKEAQNREDLQDSQIDAGLLQKVEEIIKELKIRPSDNNFARKLLKRKMISRQQLLYALQEQQHMEQQGNLVPLCNVMLTNNMILPEDIQRVFGEQAITAFHCVKCQRNYRVLNLGQQPPENFRCRICRAPLKLSGQDNELFILPEDEPSIDILLMESESLELTKENIPKLLERAMMFVKKKNIEKALDLYEQIHRIDPINEACQLGRSKIFLEHKFYGKALEATNLILEKNPNNYQALCHRGVAYYYTNAVDDSIRDLSILVEKGVHNFMSYSTRGKAFYRKKDFAKAIEDLTRALIHSPDFVKGYVYRGKSYLQLGKNRLAIHDFREALAINPEYANAKEIQSMIEFAQEREKKQE